MENLEYIDDYFTSPNTAEEKNVFEQRIINDVVFAEEVAFYIAATSAVKEQAVRERKTSFKEIYQQQQPVVIRKAVIRPIWRYMAAASVVVAIMLSTWFLFGNNTSSQQLADTYIQQNFTNLGVKMGTKQDSLQEGLKYLNNGKLSRALAQFELILKNDSLNAEAKEYAGIVSLRLKDYDEALKYFSALETDVSLNSNPGTFYKAITLMERNKDGDRAAAKLLLQQVVAKGLEDSDIAKEWLSKIK